MARPPRQLGEIADLIGGELVGSAHAIVEGVCTLSNPKRNCLAFATSLEKLESAEVPAETFVLFPRSAAPLSLSGVIVDNPRYEFARVVTAFFAPPVEPRLAESAKIHPSAKLGENVSIGEFSVIGANVRVGDGTIIRHHVVISDGVQIGSNCLIRSHAVIGEEGFGFEQRPDGSYLRIPHLGSVIIGDEVEVGTATSIARGTIDATVIGDRTKIDDQVFIAHNCQIGCDVMIVAEAEISGSVRIRNQAWIGPNACILNGISIAERTLVGMGAVVIRSTEPNGVYAGSPAKRLKDR